MKFKVNIEQAFGFEMDVEADDEAAACASALAQFNDLSPPEAFEFQKDTYAPLVTKIEPTAVRNDERKYNPGDEVTLASDPRMTPGDFDALHKIARGEV